MFYGDYEDYKKLKYNGIFIDKILSAEKYHPEWKYKITKEEMNRLIKYYKTFGTSIRAEMVINFMNSVLITEEYAMKLLDLENI